MSKAKVAVYHLLNGFEANTLGDREAILVCLCAIDKDVLPDFALIIRTTHDGQFDRHPFSTALG